MQSRIWKIIAYTLGFSLIQSPALLSLGFKQDEKCLLELNYQRILVFSSLLMDIHVLFWYILLRSNTLSFDESTFLLGSKPMTCFLAVSLPLLSFSLYVNDDLLEIFFLRQGCNIEWAAILGLWLAVFLNSALSLVSFIIFFCWIRTVIVRRFIRVTVTTVLLTIIFILMASWGFFIQTSSTEAICADIKHWVNVSLLNSIILYGGAWAYPLLYDWQGTRGLFSRRLLTSAALLTIFNLSWGIFDGFWFFHTKGPVWNPNAVLDCFEGLSSLSAFTVFSKVPTMTILYGASFLILGLGFHALRLVVIKLLSKNAIREVVDAVDHAFKGNSGIKLEKLNETDFEEIPDKSVFECSICMEMIVYDQEHAVIKDCNHRYHKQCLSDWLKQSHNCPLCRITIRSPQNL